MIRRIAVGATLMLALAGTAAGAQQMEVRVSAARGWYGFAYDVTRAQPAGRAEMIVRTVVEGTAAAKAGLRPGDRIVRLDGQPISEARLERISEGLRPGETLVARVRRGSAEHDVRLVAEPTPGRLLVRSAAGGPTITVRPDTVLQMMEVLLDSVSSAVTRFQFRAAPAGRVWVGGDSARAWVVDRDGRPFDLSGRMVRPGDVERRQAAEIAELQSILHAQTRDSTVLRHLEELRAASGEQARRAVTAMEQARVTVDARRIRELEEAAGSARGGAATVAARPVGGGWVYFGDKAIAGARFEEIGPAFRHAFGVDRGLVVMDVAPGTAAARAGLRVSDVVIAAGGRSVATVAELRARINDAGRDGLALDIVREKKRHALRLPGR